MESTLNYLPIQLEWYIWLPVAVVGAIVMYKVVSAIYHHTAGTLSLDAWSELKCPVCSRIHTANSGVIATLGEYKGQSICDYCIEDDQDQHMKELQAKQDEEDSQCLAHDWTCPGKQECSVCHSVIPAGDEFTVKKGTHIGQPMCADCFCDPDNDAHPCFECDGKVEECIGCEQHE